MTEFKVEIKAEMPSLNHLHYTDFERVYEPSDDTFLLCDAIESDKAHLKIVADSENGHGNGSLICCELGPGSGCVVTFMGLLLRRMHVTSVLYAIDINQHAANMTACTAKANGLHVDTVCADLTSGMWCPSCADVIIFNPPYVPTPSDEVGSDGIEASWAGGEDGREVIDRFLPLLPTWLSVKGICYLVLVEENRPKEVAARLFELGLKSEIILSRRARNELLHILRIQWS